MVVQQCVVYDSANDTWGLSLGGLQIAKTLSKEEAETVLKSYREIPLECLSIDTFPEDQ